MKIKTGCFFIALLMIGINAKSVLASVEKPWYVAATGGYQDISDSAFDSRTAYGVKIGRYLRPDLDLGLNILYSKKSQHQAALNTDFDFSDLFILAALNYHLDQILKGWRVGALVGLDSRGFQLLDASAKKNDVDDAAGVFGIETGYDKNFDNGMFVGAAVNYLSVGKAEKSITSNNVEISGSLKSASFLNFLVSAGIRF